MSELVEQKTVGWNVDLNVSKRLRGVRCDELYKHGIRQLDFDFLQKELLTTGNIQENKNTNSTFTNTTMAQDVDICNKVYRSLLAKCTSSGAFKLCIWKYLHQLENIPSESAQAFFDEPHALHVSNLAHAVTNVETITIKNKFRMRKTWTEHQTLAVRNTLNHFIRKYPRQTPMLCDLQHLQRNEKMLHQFIFSLFNEKADVSDEQLAEIACCRFNISLGELQYGPLSDTAMEIVSDDDELFDIILSDDEFVKEVQEASVQQHAERTDDEEKTDEVKEDVKINVETKIDTEEAVEKEVEHFVKENIRGALPKYLIFRIAKFVLWFPLKPPDVDAEQKFISQCYEEHGQDALFGVIDLYAKNIDHFVVHRSKAFCERWPDANIFREQHRVQKSSFRHILSQFRMFKNNNEIRQSIEVLEDGLWIPYYFVYRRYGRYGIRRLQRADAILDSDDLEAREDYMIQEAKKVKTEVDIEQATTVPLNISTFHHLCFRMVKFILRMPRKPPNPEKMNELIDSLYLEHGSDAIFVIDDWHAKYLKDYEIYESKAHTRTFTSRAYCRKRVVWMQKLNWIRRLQDLKRGKEVSVDVSILNEESVPVDWNVRIFVRGRYLVCMHYKKKQMAVAESCVINMDTEFHEVQREVDEFEALDARKSVNDYHYAVKLAFKTLKILMGVKREPPSPEHLKTFVKTQYTQYGTKAMFSIMDWHADCIEHFNCYSSDELCRRFDGGDEVLTHIQWTEKRSMRTMLRDLRYGKTVSWKNILLDTDGMQCHVQIESMKMGRYALSVFREIKKHKPRPLEELTEVQEQAAETTTSWIQILQTLGILAVVTCLIIIVVQNSA